MLLAVDLLRLYFIRLRYSLLLLISSGIFVIKGRGFCHLLFQHVLWWMCWTTPTSLEGSQLCDGGWSLLIQFLHLCSSRDIFFHAILMMSLSDFDIRVILFFSSHVVSCASLLSAAVVKDHDQRQLGRKGFIWRPKQSPLLKKVIPGTEGGQGFWGRTEAKTGGTLLNGLYPRLTSATFPYKLWWPAQEGHCSHQSLINKMLHRYAHGPIW